jgi:hypothetical protein
MISSQDLSDMSMLLQGSLSLNLVAHHSFETICLCEGQVAFPFESSFCTKKLVTWLKCDLPCFR